MSAERRNAWTMNIFPHASKQASKHTLPPDGRMNRCGGRQFNLLSLLFPTLDQREVLHDGGAGVRTEVDGCLVAHPAVDPSAPAVDPQSMLEAKVLWGVRGNAKSSTEEKVSI